jgi:hypothetical protein
MRHQIILKKKIILDLGNDFSDTNLEDKNELADDVVSSIILEEEHEALKKKKLLI